METKYDASSIRILSRSEIEDKFDWTLINRLAEEHKIPLETLETGLEVSRRMNISHDYFIDRYVYKKPVERNKEFEEVYMDLLKEKRNSKDK